MLLVSIFLIAAAAAATVAGAQTVPPGWSEMPRSGPEGDRLFLDLGSPLTAMVVVRESGRRGIDAPSLGEWLTRMARADLPVGGTRWSDPGELVGQNGANSAHFTRMFVSARGVKGMAQYGATSADGRQGRIIRATFGTREAMDGPRGVMARDLFMELMMAELTSEQSAPPLRPRKP